METATVEPGNDPMHEQNEREDLQRERRLLAARPHAFAQEVRIERHERNDHDDGEDCEIRPKARDGDRAGCCEQCGGRADHERACLEVSRDGHPLVCHFKGSEMPSRYTLKSKHCRLAWNVRGLMAGHGPPHSITSSARASNLSQTKA